MKYFPLIWAGLWRKRARTAFTIASLAAAFLLFGLLQGVDSAFTGALERQRVDRLLTDPRFGEPALPRTYSEQIERLPLVRDLTWTVGLPSFFQDPKNRVMLIGTEPSRFFKVRDEYETSPDTLERLQRTRSGLIVLEKLAEQHGWKVGDKVTFRSAVPRTDGSSDWTFDLVGVLRNTVNPGQIGFGVFNYDYGDEARALGKGTVARFVIRIANPARAVEAGNAIDKLFLSSSAPTRTVSENELAQTQLASVGEVNRVIRVVIATVFFSILFLTGNTLLRAVRERSAELAVLKTLGFPDLRVLWIVVSEAVLLCLSGAAIGLGAALIAFPLLSERLPSVSAYVGNAPMSMSAMAIGIIYALVLAILSAAIPAWHTTRLKIVDALLVR
jgi:putative ABC transport system permease protein